MHLKVAFISYGKVDLNDVCFVSWLYSHSIHVQLYLYVANCKQSLLIIDTRLLCYVLNTQRNKHNYIIILYSLPGAGILCVKWCVFLKLGKPWVSFVSLLVYSQTTSSPDSGNIDQYQSSQDGIRNGKHCPTKLCEIAARVYYLYSGVSTTQTHTAMAY